MAHDFFRPAFAEASSQMISLAKAWRRRPAFARQSIKPN